MQKTDRRQTQCLIFFFSKIKNAIITDDKKNELVGGTNGHTSWVYAPTVCFEILLFSICFFFYFPRLYVFCVLFGQKRHAHPAKHVHRTHSTNAHSLMRATPASP